MTSLRAKLAVSVKKGERLALLASRLEGRIAQLEDELKAAAKELGATKNECQAANDELAASRRVDGQAALYRAKLQVEAERGARLTGALMQLQAGPLWPVMARLHAFERRFPKFCRAILAAQKGAVWMVTFRVPSRLRLRRTALTILRSGLFDEQAYCNRYPEVVLSGFLPIYHWCLIGWKHGYYPNPLFHSAWYTKDQSQRPDA